MDNLPDLDEVEQIVKDNVEFVTVESVDEILSGALVNMPGIEAIEIEEIYTVDKSVSDNKQPIKISRGVL